MMKTKTKAEEIPITLLLTILLIVVMETAAMTCFKKCLHHSHIWFLVGVALYAVVGMLLVYSYSFRGLGMVNAIWSAISVIATTAVGVLYFKETLHMHDYVAIAFIAAGVVILKVTN
jgi:multidrug transporter EmrE-like cation transporter